jgi:hypothetical protein
LVFTSIVFPETQQFAGIGRELAAGTNVASVITVPVDKIDVEDKPELLLDNALRSTMADGAFAGIQGTEIGGVSVNGPVYMDTLGYFLHNILGDYSATGSTPTNSTTLTASVAVGATSASVTSGTGYSIGQSVQIGAGTAAEVVTLTNVTGTTLTFTGTPARLAHLSAAAVATVVAPFTHVFCLLNSGNGQPVTHTFTHYQGISASSGARVYPYWCASDVTLTFDAMKLFEHSTKGTSVLSSIAGSKPVNTLSGSLAQPAWRTLMGIGGPATGGTLVSDPLTFELTITRKLKPLYTLSGQQSPFIIGRYGLGMAGKFSEIAQSETPYLNLLNNTQPQLQVVITNGGSGASLLSCQIDIATAAYKTTKLNAADEIQYDTDFVGINNSTDIGASGGLAAGKVTLINATPTY